MPNWKEVLWRECGKAYHKGGEIKAIFIRRQNKVVPIIQSYIDNQVKCDEETVVNEED